MPISSELVATMAFSSPAFQASLYLGANLASQRAVVRVRYRPGLILVDLQRDLLRQPPAVGEEQGGLISVDQRPKAVGQRFPDLLAILQCGFGVLGEAHAELDLFVGLRGHDADWTLGAVGKIARHIAGDPHQAD